METILIVKKGHVLRTIEVVNLKNLSESKKHYVNEIVNDYINFDVKFLILRSSDKVEDITGEITSILQ